MCGTDGSCNGSGACRRYAAGTVCVPATCATTSSVTPNATCNASGTCVTPATIPCAPYACNAGACRTTCTTTADCSGAPNVCTGTTCGSATNVTVHLAARELSPTNQAVMPDFKLFNNGMTPIPLSEMTLRYWYTIDSAQAQTAFVDFATIGGTNVSLSFAAVSPARMNADFYLQVSFAAAAGNLAAGANTGNIQTRFHKNDFSVYNEANDYSYIASTSFMPTTMVTAYRLGVLVYGTEPPAP
jgi:endoglucanase